ncbi:hypothetical protein [Dactylosporangium sp. NPDC051484]|uniref:hypothetical protein n=1 Tax=Dactylosporangium sp. NPDC051484 TaxID=3154942 RepID=UPI00345053C8
MVGTAALVLAVLPGFSGVASAAAAAPTQIGNLFPITPSRILDTREGNGAPKRTLGPNGTLKLQVAGRGGVPASGVSAVVLNVTVTNPSLQTFMTVYPSGISRPNASNLNITKGWTGANSVTVKLGADGAVNIWNQVGTLDVIADVTGFYAGTESAGAAGAGGEYFPWTPFRLIDSREYPDGKLRSGEYYQLPVGFADTSLNPHIKAVAINVTAVNANADGFFTVWNGVGSRPNTSLLNFVKGAIVPNMAIVPTSACDWCGSEGLPSNMQQFAVQYSGFGSADVIVDVLGVFDDNTIGEGLHFTPTDPTRIVDTREGLGIPKALGPATTSTTVLPSNLRGDGTWAIAANVTGVTPTSSTFVQLWPTSRPKPAAGSTLNLNPGDIKPNSALIGLDDHWSFSAYNHLGTTNLVIDVNGVYNKLLTTATAKAATSKTQLPQGDKGAGQSARKLQP